MAYYGRRVTAGDVDVGMVVNGTARATVYDALSQNGWGYAIGAWMGGFVGYPNPNVRLGAYAVDGSPTHRLGYTAQIPITADMVNGTTGASYQSAVTNATTSPATHAIKMYAGNRYAIAINPTGEDVQFAMIAAAKFTATNKNLYTRTGVTTPPNPFSHTSSSYEGHIDAWIEYQPNRTPTAATSAPNGLITTQTPTFSGTFSDADSVYGDRMTRYRIQVTRVSDGALMWDSGTVLATAGEQSTSIFSRAYGGSTLVAGTQYQWRAQVADEFTTWSAWTSYRTFTVNGGGIISNQGTPTGKVTSIAPTPFTATWGHANSLAMTHVQVRIKQGNTILLTGNEVAKAVTVGNAISTTWTEQFASAMLDWGVSYSWEMRGKDSSGLWSNWSTARAFNTNNPPDIPYALTPSQSQASSSRPLLRATSKDADGDNVTVYARIKNAAGTILFTRTMTRQADGTHTYQTNATDLASYGVYKWDAYAWDGSLYSGAQLLAGNAVKSSEAAFIYAEGPTVTITNPSTIVTASTVLVTWNTTDQQKKRIVLSQNGQTVWDSGTWTSTNPSHWIPSGYIREGQTYDLTVTVTNSATLSGTSEVLTFTVDYPTPASIANFTASPEYQQFDMAPSSVRLHWDESTDPNFAEYLITRSDGVQETILARTTSQEQTVYVDYLPESGVEYDYSIVQSTVEGLDVLVSNPVHAQAQVDLMHVVLSDVTDGTNRVGLAFDEDRGIEHIDDLVLEHPWGQRAPTGIYGTAQYMTFAGSFKLITDDQATATEHINALRELWRSRATVCYRDERGRKFFGKIRRFSEKDRRVQFYTVELDIVEIGYHEGSHE